MDKKIKILLAVSAVFTLGICLLMNSYLIPAIESTTGGLRVFDMNSFGYGFDQAKSFLDMLSENGRNLYLHVQLPLDFFYPICYTLFFALSFKTLNSAKWIYAPVFILPILDYAENIFTITMLKTEPSKVITTIASTVTVCKSMIMYLIFVLLIIYIVKYIRHRKKKEA